MRFQSYQSLDLTFVNSQYNMTHSKLLLQGLNLQQPQFSSSLRTEIIDKFLSIKQKSPTLNRETIFTALAIYQKYILQKYAKNVFNQETTDKREIQIATCLWISIKVQCYEKSILTQILRLFETPISKSQIVLTEAQILQTIDYQIPLYHTYTSMILQFNKRSLWTIEKNAELVAQCLAFYCQAIKLSSDFVLEQKLGINIVTCLADRCISDSRIRLACKSIRRNRNRRNQQLQVSHNNNMTVKVCQ